MQCLSEDDIELVKQHRLIKKRLRSLCDELVAKRESLAVKTQETARSYQQSVHEAMVNLTIKCLHFIMYGLVAEKTETGRKN